MQGSGTSHAQLEYNKDWLSWAWVVYNVTYYRSIEEAQRDANSCVKGEGGQFCGSLLELNRIRARYIEGNCSSVLSPNSSCPSNCRSLLEDFRSTLGCCINTYVNGSRIYSGDTSLDYRVWNMCDVSLPPAACENVPTLNPPSNVQNCTHKDFFNKYYVEKFCLPKRRQAYIDVLESSICRNSTQLVLLKTYVQWIIMEFPV